MAEEEKKGATKMFGMIDKVFDNFSSYLSDRISAFVSFLFVLIALGGFYGYLIVPRFPELSVYLLLAPLGVALIAYYSRTFASIVFVLLLFLVFLL